MLRLRLDKKQHFKQISWNWGLVKIGHNLPSTRFFSKKSLHPTPHETNQPHGW